MQKSKQNVGKIISSQVKKQDFFEIFQYDFCGSSLLLFHSGLGTGSGGVTEISYRSTDSLRQKNRTYTVLRNIKQNK